MGKKGGGKVEVNDYLMSMHLGVCAAVDSFKRIVIGEMDAWVGSVSKQQAVTISKRDLFGGPKKEGGVAGLAHFLPGAQDQVLSDGLAQKLGRADGTDCPGFRGLASIFFTGGANAEGFVLPDGTVTVADTVALLFGIGRTADYPGFYWVSNNPYLKDIAVEALRAPKGLDPDYALIDTRGTSIAHPWLDAPGLGPTPLILSISADQKFMLMADIGAFGPVQYALINLETHAQVDTGALGSGVQVYDVDAQGNMWAVGPGPAPGNYLICLAGDGVTGIGAAIGPLTDNGFSTDADDLFVFDYGGTPFVAVAPILGRGNVLYYHDGNLVTFNSVDVTGGSLITWAPNFWAQDTDGEIWAGGTQQGGLTTNKFVLYSPTNGRPTMIVTMPSSITSGGVRTIPFRHFSDATHDHFLVNWNGEIVLVDRASGAVLDHFTYSDGAYTHFKNCSPGSRSWFQYDSFNTVRELSAVDGTLTRVIDLHDWNGAASYTSGIFSPIDDNWIGLNGGDGAFYALNPIVDGDANPSHMIYELLVNRDWGMGAVPSLIDRDSFEAAAVTLYNEGLGLSMLWTRQDTVENFVGEILKHIQASVFVNPRTGLLTIKLIRDDYDPDDLAVITPDNALLSNFQRKGWGEINNEVVVTWTNPATEQDETVTAQDLAGITAQGGIVSTSRNFYGVRTGALAMTLAARELRSEVAPLASCDVELDRTEWDLLPGDVRKITWPEHGISDMVMRVGPVDYGKPGDPTIKASLVEDVFSFATGEFETPPGSAWVDENTTPEPVEHSRMITVPTFLTANYLSAGADDTTLSYPDVLAGVLASSTSGLNYDLLGPTAEPDGTTVDEVQATNTLLGYATLSDALAAEASSTGVEFSGRIGRVRPAKSVFLIIGAAADGEDVMEVAMITVAAAGAYTLARGLLDTVPRAWVADTPVWMLDVDSDISDLRAKSDGETVTYKMLTRTFGGVLDTALASSVTGMMGARPWLPNRPANVKAHGEAWSSETAFIDATARPDPWLTVEWSNRNRTLEDSQVLLWTDATVTPENGQTTRIEVVAVDGTPITTHDGLSGTSFDVPDASFSGHTFARLQVFADRTDDAGDFTSLQFFEHWVQVGAVTADSTTVTSDSTLYTADEN